MGNRMPFLSKLDVSLTDQYTNDGRVIWRVDSPLVYESSDRTIIVPSGTLTDFASVPRLPIAFWFTADCAHAAAVIHDYLYATGSVSKRQADKIFLQAMEETGVSWLQRKLMYRAVRLFGGSHYKG